MSGGGVGRGGVDVDAAAAALGAALPSVPRVAVVLGSGLAALEESIAGPVSVPFTSLPGLPAPGVEGHGGRFVHGRIGGEEVLLQAGRFHAYEGHPLDVVVAPVRILATLGVECVLMTNAVGGIAPLLEPGSIVLIDDFLSFTFRSPLVGPVVKGEERFPDMSAPFDAGLCDAVRVAAAREGIELHDGTYAWTLGPQFETPAEIRMLGRLGADVVGMSTVPEVIVAVARGLRVVVLSLVTNRAAGLGSGSLSHAEVIGTGRAAGDRMARLVRETLRLVAPEDRGPQPISAK